MANTRFGGQILFSNAGWFRDLPQSFCPDYVGIMDDFQRVDDDQTNDWTVVKDSGAAVGIVADTANGELALTSAATTDADGASIQGNEIFLPAAGRTIWFETKVKVVDANDCDMFVGLCQNFASNPEACLTASNRIGIQLTEGSAVLLCKSEVADTETSTSSGVSAEDATYVVLGLRVNGVANIEFFVNRQRVATHTTVPATEMTPALMHISGSTTGTMSLISDYVMAVQTR